MLLDEFWLGFWGYWHCEKFLLQAWMNLFMMYVGNFVGMCKFYFMYMANFLWVRIWKNLWVQRIFVDMEEVLWA